MQQKSAEFYKGFVARPVAGAPWKSAFFIRADGFEACVGQTYDIRKIAEWYLRRPLPTWMTGLSEPVWSEHSDRDMIANTCVHGIALDNDCDGCCEAYGENRMV